MTLSKIIAIAAFAVVTTSAHATSITVNPMQASCFQFGSEHALSYFTGWIDVILTAAIFILGLIVGMSVGWLHRGDSREAYLYRQRAVRCM